MKVDSIAELTWVNELKLHLPNKTIISNASNLRELIINNKRVETKT